MLPELSSTRRILGATAFVTNGSVVVYWERVCAWTARGHNSAPISKMVSVATLKGFRKINLRLLIDVLSSWSDDSYDGI